MDTIFTIAKRELQSFFDSLIAYILLFIFLSISGYFIWVSDANIFFQGQASLQLFFDIAFWSLFFFIPAITMKLIAEETRSGTIELLLTKPVSSRQLVLGKFFGALSLIIIALLLTLPYYFTVSSIGEMDHGKVLSGYFGLILMSMAYIGIGLFASSLSNNQIVSFLIAIMIGLIFQLIFGVLSNSTSGVLGMVFDYMFTGTHFDSVVRGVIDTKDIIYFLSISSLGIFLSELMISKKIGA